MEYVKFFLIILASYTAGWVVARRHYLNRVERLEKANEIMEKRLGIDSSKLVE